MYIQDVYNILGALYLAVLFLAIINAMTVQPVVGLGRVVSWRERAAGDTVPFLCFALIHLWFCVSYFMSVHVWSLHNPMHS